MKISIIIPVYNVEPYIERCFNSVVAQTYNNQQIECLFIDDCSPDNCHTILERKIEAYQGDIDFKTIRHPENKGLSGARNTGVDSASGEYLYFFDSDDEITPNCIEHLVSLAQKHSQCDYVQGSAVWISAENTNTFRNTITVNNEIPELINASSELQKRMLLFGELPVIACNRLIKKDFILDNNLYFKQGIIHEDEEWNIRAFNKINSISFTQEITYKYYTNECSITLNADKTNSIQSYYESAKTAMRIYNENKLNVYRYKALLIGFNVTKRYFSDNHTLKADFLNYTKADMKTLVKQKSRQSFLSKCIEAGIISLFLWPESIQKLIIKTKILSIYNRLFWLYRNYLKKNLA